MNDSENIYNINYPYKPAGWEYQYVPENDEFMSEARLIWQESGCVKRPTGAVVVKDGKVIGRGSNAGIKVEYCRRWGSPTGEDYEACRDICRQIGHAEETAIQDAINNGFSPEGADLYFYGHWWVCENCWHTIMGAGIKNIYLLHLSWEVFNPEINTEMKEWGRPKDR
jgi:deoxycytidylate deaminase